VYKGCRVQPFKSLFPNLVIRLLVKSATNRVIFERLYIDVEFSETIPQGLKPSSFRGVCGTTEVVPFQNINDHLRGARHLLIL
jgi:hypothetical protein